VGAETQQRLQVAHSVVVILVRNSSLQRKSKLVDYEGSSKDELMLGPVILVVHSYETV
jgi:hypothetical protein